MSLYDCTLVLKDERHTQQMAEALAKLPLTGSVWLSGDLGTGKTTLTRYWLFALGHQGAVKSPTYTLVEPYDVPNQLPVAVKKSHQPNRSVYHADLYRLQDAEELSFIGFDEYLEEEDALIIIEWASRASDYLPTPVLYIDINPSSEGRVVNLRLSQEGILKGLQLDDLKYFHAQ